MPAQARFLYLRFRSSPSRLLERLAQFDAGVRRTGSQVMVPLGERHPEEVLAECRRLGLRVLGSVVESSDAGG
jgi:hypothetical protein